MTKGKRDRARTGGPATYHGEPLIVGHLYTCTRHLPLMPEVNPLDNFTAMARAKRLDARERFHVVAIEERLNPGAEKFGPRWWAPWTWRRVAPPPLPPWYRVRCAHLPDEWYINPAAMVGALVTDKGPAL